MSACSSKPILPLSSHKSDSHHALKDQGQLFILANTTYLSPCGQAQILLADHRGTETVAVTAQWPGSSLDVVAVRDTHAETVTLRVVNTDLKESVNASFIVWGCSSPQGEANPRDMMANITLLHGVLEAQNYPGVPNNIAPIRSSMAAFPITSNGTHGVQVTALEFLPTSFTTVTVSCRASGTQRVSAEGTTCGAPLPPAPPAPFTWLNHTLVPVGDDAWSVRGESLVFGSASAVGIAYVRGVNLEPQSGLHASVDILFPEGTTPGPTSVLVRFDATDSHLGEGGVDAFRGYECAIEPGLVRLGFHDHSYKDLKDVSTDSIAQGHTHHLEIDLAWNSAEAGSHARSLGVSVSVDGAVLLSFIETDTKRLSAVAGSGIALRGFRGVAVFSGLTFHSS